MKEERQWGIFLFPKNNKIKSVLTVSSKTIQLEIRVIMKKQGGGRVSKLFHFSNQNKIKNKNGNLKKNGYPIAISQQFQSIQVPIQPNTDELSPSGNLLSSSLSLFSRWLSTFLLKISVVVTLMVASTEE